MKALLKYSLPALALMGLVFTGCKPELDVPEASAGSATFSKYVAVGNSLTAGYADEGLYREGQENSYPAILAQQFALAGGGSFTQPLFSEAQRNGTGYRKLTGFVNGNPIIIKDTVTQVAYTGAVLPGGQKQLAKYTGTTPINNYGVPGLSVLASSVPQYSGGNPYFERIVPSPGTTSYLKFVGESNPTFFTSWLGNNDVLTYALAGGVDDPGNFFDGITDTTAFRLTYNALVDTLMQNNAKGVLANVPDITSIPFFTLVTPAAVLASAPAGTKLYISPAQGVVREATAEDLILLSTRSVINRVDTLNTPQGPVPIPHGFHPLNPLTNAEVLDVSEVEKIKAATIAFNQIIAKIAQNKNLGLADMNQLLRSIQPSSGNQYSGPIYTYGVANTPAFISGNIFSLDGIHLTPRGNAIVANKFIQVINQKYGANLPSVNPNNYRGVKFP